MKSFIGAMIIFAALVGGGILFNTCIDNTTNKMISHIEKIDKDIEKENFEDANKKAKELSEFVDKRKPLLASILDHGNIDEIESEISDLLGYTEKSDFTESAVSVKRLQHHLEHLPENYRLELQNIL